MTRSTSFRLSDASQNRLSDQAQREGISATELLERLIIEGTSELDHPGIVFRGPTRDRRAALAAGPDVWEIVSRLQELGGQQEERIATLNEESELHPRLIRIAIEYAVEHPDDIERRINHNRELAERSRRAAEQRAELIA